MSTTLLLYGTSACHLCEQAEVLLQSLQPSLQQRGLKALHITKVDIADDDQLLARYGVRIPVLREEEVGRELDWPFTGSDVLLWLGLPAAGS